MPDSQSRQSIPFSNPLKVTLLLSADASASKPQLLAELCSNCTSIAMTEEHRQAPNHMLLSGQCVKKENNWLEFRLKWRLLKPLLRANFLLDVQYRTDKNAWESHKMSSGHLFRVEDEFEFLAVRARHSGVQLCQDASQPSYLIRLEMHVVSLDFLPSQPLRQRVIGNLEPTDFEKKGANNTLELEVEGRKLWALPECLSLQSEFFRARIAESRDGGIQLPNRRFADVKRLLRLLFPASSERLDVESAPAQLALADELKIGHVKATAERVLVAGMRGGVVSPVLGFLLARRHRSVDMETAAVPLLAGKSLKDLEKDPAFGELPDCDRSLLLLKKVEHMESR